jgi:hypothetical protein
VRFVVEAGVSTHSFQPKFVNPERLKQLQEIFDLAWQEISALTESGIEGDNANRLRNELAKTIIAAQNMEPALIRETVLYKIRMRKFGRRRQAA